MHVSTHLAFAVYEESDHAAFVCVSACVLIFILYACVWMYTYVCGCIRVSVDVFVDVYICVWMYIYACVCIRMCV